MEPYEKRALLFKNKDKGQEDIKMEEPDQEQKVI
jgi:hypothetical protein